MRLDPDRLSAQERYKLLTGTVVPRPIGWIATVDEGGTANLAPFSFFMVAAATPPTLVVSVGSREGAPKDTARNALATGGFVAHLPNRSLLDAMNETSAEVERAVDEFARAGLTAVPSERVAAPRVLEAPVAFECRLEQHLQVGANTLLFGTVVLAHLHDGLRDEQGRVDVTALDPVGRLAGTQYTALGEILERTRPGRD